MLQKQVEHQIRDLEAMQAFAVELADILPTPSCVYLIGNLGAGKTTLVQFMLESLGVLGPITSPTYNLIQSYDLESKTIHHLDLYRLHDPEELEYLGLLELWDERSVFLIEWPQKGGSSLFPADLTVNIEVSDKNTRKVVLS